MLQVGNVGLTLEEQKSHFTLWCLMGGPLLISTDLAVISNEALAILKAPEVIAVNQDPLAKQGVRIGRKDVGGIEVWGKDAKGVKEHDGFAVVLLNRGAAAANATLVLGDLPGGWAGASVRDLWLRKGLGCFKSSFAAGQIPSHGVVMLLLTRARAGRQHAPCL